MEPKGSLPCSQEPSMQTYTVVFIWPSLFLNIWRMCDVLNDWLLPEVQVFVSQYYGAAYQMNYDDVFCELKHDNKWSNNIFEMLMHSNSDTNVKDFK
jgi:hypothetical protein